MKFAPFLTAAVLSSPMLLGARTLLGAECSGRLRELAPPVLLPVEGPQGVALDETDGSLWICSAISNTVLHLDRNLKITGSFEAPFEQFDRHEVSGIAYNPIHDTLYLTQPVINEVWEVEK